MTGEFKIETDALDKLVRKSVERFAENLEETAKQMKPMGLVGDPEVGDEVVVENTNGDHVKGTVKKEYDKTAEEVEIWGGAPLDEYWNNHGEHIEPTERVYGIQIQGKQIYDYPESKVGVAIDEVKGHPDTEETEYETFECNWCFQEFRTDEADPVEGDEGELYCSLDCLNNEYA